MRFRVSKLQAFLLVFITSFCTTPFGFPTLYIELGRQVWMAGVLQALVCTFGAWGVWLLLRRAPQARIADLATGLLGPFLGRAYLLLLGVFLLIWGPLGNLAVLIRMMLAVSTELTPPWALAAAMTVAAIYACRSGPEVIARTLEVWGWILLPGVVLLVAVPYVASQGQLHPGLLLPLAPPPAGAATSPTVWSYALGARGFILALVLAGRTVSGRALGWPVLGGTVASTLLLTLMITAPTAIFPVEVLRHFRYPVLQALDSVDLAALGLHSTVTVTLVLWPVISWAVVASTLWGAAEAFSGAFGLRSYRPLLWPLAAAPLLAGVWSPPPSVFAAIVHGWSLLAYAVGVAAPWGMWMLAAIRDRRSRGRRGAQHEAQSSRT